MLQTTVESGRQTRSSSRVDRFSFDNVYEVTAFLTGEIRNSGLSYGTLASRAGVCYSTVANLAYGTTKAPHLRTAIEILKVLGFKVWVTR